MDYITHEDDIKKWFAGRIWSLSGNKAAAADSTKMTSKAGRVVFPTSTNEVAQLLASLPPSTPVVSVCGGHSSSNDSTVAVPNAVVVDLQRMTSVDVDKANMEVTVGGGTVFRALAEAVADADGSLPIGTGDTVGVAGYILNGGISGYFGRRLGMLGQRVTRLTIVLADGTIKELAPDSTGEDAALFQAVLGAGSALGIVTSITLKIESGSAFQTGGQVVVACGNVDAAKKYTQMALKFLTGTVLPDPSISMELVVTADYTCICTLLFFDTFKGDPSTSADPLIDAAKACDIPVVANDLMQWKLWFEAASCLWPIIAEMKKASSLVRIDHCMGTKNSPTDEVLDFVVNDWIAGMPFDLAPMSIVEVRTLGGATLDAATLPSGNSKCQFFVDMIVAYDAHGKSVDERSQVTKNVNDIVSRARDVASTHVDFSGTHSMSDDDATETRGVHGEDIFDGKESYDTVRTIKQKVDPSNRFCCHPFASVLGSEQY